MDAPKEIHRLFHAINDKLNIISVKTGAFLCLVKETDHKSLSKEELLKELEQVKNDFTAMEEAALQAGAFNDRLQDEVYEALGIKKSIE